MDSIRDNILPLLKSMKGGGKFAFSDSSDFILPGLDIENIGSIGFPINEVQAKLLIGQAEKSPFGMGTKTVYDDSVRRTKEFHPNQIKINNPQWQKFINNALKNLKGPMGLEDEVIEASLYRLLIYEKGDFFLPHKDTEKEKGMFGTMVVELPATHSGGALVVRYGGEEVISDYSDSENLYKLNYTAFYADCEHEVKPLLSGYRVCLVYNLIRKNTEQPIQPLTLNNQAEFIAEILRNEKHDHVKKPFIFLLGHQYTPENFSAASLKLDDKFKANALLKAAELAGFYSKLCLVTSYKMGSPEYDPYDDFSTEIDEVLDEHLSITHWIENNFPDFDEVFFEEEDLIATFNIEDDEPLIQENSGYMGNYGPDIEHWYHYGAVMVWSNEANAKLLKTATKKTQLKWIEYFNQTQSVSTVEKEAIRQSFLLDEDQIRRDRNENYDSIADWILIQKDFDRFLNLNDLSKKFYFKRISAEKWLEIFQKIDKEQILNFTGSVIVDSDTIILEKLIEIIKKMYNKGLLPEIAEFFALKIPVVLESLYSQDNHKKISLQGLKDLYSIENQHSFDEGIGNLLVIDSGRDYQNNVLIPFFFESERKGNIYPIIFQFVYRKIKNRADNQPKKHDNYTRHFPENVQNSILLNEIKVFMESPVTPVFDFKKNESKRDELERCIRTLNLDLTVETIRKGSPYILRLTKNTASYQRALNNWKEDSILFQKLEGLGI